MAAVAPIYQTFDLPIRPTFLTNPPLFFLSRQEDLRIGSVYSVLPSGLPLAPAANPASLHMSCSHCSKSLIKGQTAFQRKGSPAIFCTTNCLTASLTAAKPSKVCQNCLRRVSSSSSAARFQNKREDSTQTQVVLKPRGQSVQTSVLTSSPRPPLPVSRLILRPQDVILSPDAKGVMKEFCSQSCLTTFNVKKNGANVGPHGATSVAQPGALQSICSVCSSYCVVSGEETVSLELVEIFLFARIFVCNFFLALRVMKVQSLACRF